MARSNKAPKPLTEAPPEPDSSNEDSSSTEIEDSQDNNNNLHQQQEVPDNDDDEDDDVSSSSSDEKPLQKTPSKKPTTTNDDDDENDDVSSDEPPTAKSKSISLTTTTTPPPKSTTKPRSKPNVSGLTSEKRQLEADDKEKSTSKKPRKDKDKDKDKNASVVSEEGGSVKKQSVPFQRLFSDNDEVVMLKGMIDYKEKNGVDPMIDVEDFYGFIKGLIGCDVKKSQVADKIRRLKRKYYNVCKKKVPGSSHEVKLLELGKKIWGSSGGEAEENEGERESGKSNGVTVAVVGLENSNVGGKSKAKGGKSKGSVEKEKEKEKEEKEEWKIAECDVKDMMEVEVGEEAARERVRKKGLKLMGAKARGELAEMWDKVVVAQKEVDEMRFEVLKEENRRIVEALKSSNQ